MEKPADVPSNNQYVVNLASNSLFSVNQMITLRSNPELYITTVSKSLHDNTMIMKWHNFFRSCVDLKIVIITNVFKTTPEKKKIMLRTHKNIK